MIGQIIMSPIHRGQTFTSVSANGRTITYHLLDGSSVARSSYPDMTTTVWPVGAYGSTSNNFVLPDLSAGYYLRGADLGRGADPNAATRTTFAGAFPTGDRPGSQQGGSLKSHSHASGKQQTVPNGGGYWPSTPSKWSLIGTTPASTNPTGNFPSGRTIFGPSGPGGFDFYNFKFYPYLVVGI